MNMGKRLIRKTTFFNKKSRTLSFASWQNFASIENMTFRDLNVFTDRVSYTVPVPADAR
jgi:hypothetical protein